MKRLIVQILAAIAGLWIATMKVPGVEFRGEIATLASAGLVLGLLNFFIKPILKAVTLPLRILTFNFFTVAISMGLLWIVDMLTPDLTIIRGFNVKEFAALFWTTLIITAIGYVLSLFIKKSKNKPENNDK